MHEKKGILVPKKLHGLLPEIKQYSHEDVLQMSNIFYESKFLPDHIKSPQGAYVAMRWAIAIGLDPFLGLKDIYVIDNIPTLKTEAALALVLSSGFCECIEQYYEGVEDTDDFTAICKIKRKGQKEHISKFSVKDAKNAKLWMKKTKSGQDTAWVGYRQQMLLYRAVGFALRNIFPDALRGAKLYEEVIDYTQFEIVEQTTGSDGTINATVKKAPDKKSGMGKISLDDFSDNNDTDFEEVK